MMVSEKIDLIKKVMEHLSCFLKECRLAGLRVDEGPVTYFEGDCIDSDLMHPEFTVLGLGDSSSEIVVSYDSIEGRYRVYTWYYEADQDALSLDDLEEALSAAIRGLEDARHGSP